MKHHGLPLPSSRRFGSSTRASIQAPGDGRADHASRRIRRGDPWSQSVRPAMRNPRCGRPRIGNEPGMARGRDRRSRAREIRAIPSTATLSPVSYSSVMRGLHLVRPQAVPLQNAAHGGHGHPLRQSPHRPVSGACPGGDMARSTGAFTLSSARKRSRPRRHTVGFDIPVRLHQTVSPGTMRARQARFRRLRGWPATCSRRPRSPSESPVSRRVDFPPVRLSPVLPAARNGGGRTMSRFRKKWNRLF